MRLATASDVRGAIAGYVLGEMPPERIGGITLHPHQRDAAGRLERALREQGGALLADDVGLGKTFAALVLARAARTAVVIAPAALRDSWRSSAQLASVPVQFHSIESLGHRGAPDVAPDLVIIDEAHHLRSRRTKRFAAASVLCRGAMVLLLSATPVQNRIGDLRTVLSLFLGERAFAMPEAELASFVVRRLDGDITVRNGMSLPVLEPPEWLPPISDADCLDRLIALPPALPPADGGDAGVLLTYTLVRQWSSSRAALRGALQRRLARGLAMEHALRTGRLPSRAELSAWCFADGAVQLSFPELMVRTERPDAGPLLSQVQTHLAGVRDLTAWLDASPDPDRARANAVRDLLRRRHGERIVAFSEYGDTVTALYRALARDTRAALLTHAGGRVAGGAITRHDVLKRFAPGAGARASAPDRIDLLLTTDVLSEGVNLQDASVVLHLDLCWNPARLEQRVGRLRRIGASRDSIGVFMLPPPAPAERLLQLENRLRLKLAVAGRSVGVAGAILPGLTPDARTLADVSREERIAATIRGWRRGNPAAEPIAAAVRAHVNGALACARQDGGVALIAVTDSLVTRDRGIVEAMARAAGGTEIVAEMHHVTSALDRIEQWLTGRTVTGVVDLSAMQVARARRVLLHRVNAIARRAPRAAQPRLAPLMRAARNAATAALSAGAERVLDELACSAMGDEAWLHAISEFAALHARRRRGAEVLALLILRRD